MKIISSQGETNVSVRLPNNLTSFLVEESAMLGLGIPGEHPRAVDTRPDQGGSTLGDGISLPALPQAACDGVVLVSLGSHNIIPL